MRVLVVEDDRRIASFLVKGLEAEGYETEVVDDGARAVSVLIARSSDFDLVLLDLGLPRASGEDVLRLLRGSNTRLPVIVLTARDGERDKIHGLDLGANDYVTKPFSFAELLACAPRCARPSLLHQQNSPPGICDSTSSPRWHGAPVGESSSHRKNGLCSKFSSARPTEFCRAARS